MIVGQLDDRVESTERGLQSSALLLDAVTLGSEHDALLGIGVSRVDARQEGGDVLAAATPELHAAAMAALRG